MHCIRVLLPIIHDDIAHVVSESVPEVKTTCAQQPPTCAPSIQHSPASRVALGIARGTAANVVGMVGRWAAAALLHSCKQAAALSSYATTRLHVQRHCPVFPSRRRVDRTADHCDVFPWNRCALMAARLPQKRLSHWGLPLWPGTTGNDETAKV